MLSGQVFQLQNSTIIEPRISKPATIPQLIDILNAIIHKKGLKPLGCDYLNAPNKEWLINCIYTLDHMNEIFTPEDKTHNLDIISKLDKE
jgi:hypothetical protein